MSRLAGFVLWALLAAGAACTPALGAERMPLSAAWEFHLGELPGAPGELPPNAAWQAVSLPHDWSIEFPTDPAAATGGGGGYFPAGTGWYRTTFAAPGDWRDREVALYFEGVYRNAEVWLNGNRLGSHAYGYTPFRFAVTRHLRFDAANELLVKAANEPQPNSRWYSGSGIYRPVWLELRPNLHFEPDSVFVTTRALAAAEATLDLAATIANVDRLTGNEQVTFTLIGADGSVAGSSVVDLEPRDDESTLHVASRLTVEEPLAWTPESPHLYTLRATLRRAATILERSDHDIGLRTLRWSAQRGFELNGRSIELFGGNVHHDHGPLGAAAHPEAEWRKVALLKSVGFNAVRTAHNPPSEAFLDACDRLGLLVIDEAFDGWKVGKTAQDYSRIFEANWEKDIRAMVRRDRNHPSVVMWSIGNEVYERGADSGIERAHAMAAVIRQLDRSRPVTIGLNGLGDSGDWSRLDGIFDALDTAGYNYALEWHEEDRQRRPNRVVYASESYQAEAFRNWQIVRDHRHIIGDFVWSALDYLGEAGIGRVFPPDEEARAHWVGEHYPWHGAWCGDIDLTGTRKPISHYRNIVWNRGETLHAAVLVPPPGGQPWNLTRWSVPPALSSWTWPGREGSELTVEVYSRHPAVELRLNGRSIGRAPTTEADEFRARFEVPYRPGRLEVVGGSETFALETAGTPARLAFVDSTLPTLPGARLHYAVVEIRDAEGTWHPHADRPIELSVTGPGRIVAVGSGDLASTESYRDNPRRSFQGRALAVVEVDPATDGPVTLRAAADALEPAEMRLR